MRAQLPRPDTTPEAVSGRLLEAYRTRPGIGLVLGAGVSMDSGVAGYLGLARRVLERARRDGRLSGLSEFVVAVFGRGTTTQPDPEELFEYLRLLFAGSRAEFNELVAETLYENVELRSHKMVAAATYRMNSTLDAVISFCAARPGTAHASESLTPRARVAANKRVAAILTTNYDNLVEGAFGSKYRKSGIVRPVGRLPVSYRPGTIPVYHWHGYASYERSAGPGSPHKTSNLLIAERDYFSAFYDLLGFGNVAASHMLRAWPTLFVGSSLRDRNIRRILYQFQSESLGVAEEREHFAIMLRSDDPEIRAIEVIDDDVLGGYGVSVIRVGDKSEIVELLRNLYLSPDDVDGAEEWAWVKQDLVAPPDEN